MYNLPPPDTSGVWVFASTLFNFAWPYLAIALELICFGVVVMIIIAVYRYIRFGRIDD